MRQEITPFLWFDGQAEEAVKFYLSVFKNAKVNGTTHYGEEGPGPKGSVMTIHFELNGQEFIALNGGPDFKFTEAVSFLINCETQAEIDYYWEKLTVGGGSEIQCGWLKDKYGLCWQIVPSKFREWALAGDAPAMARMMHKLMQMTKLDLATLQAAYDRK